MSTNAMSAWEALTPEERQTIMANISGILLEPRTDLANCPAGFICEEEMQSNCTRIRIATAAVFGFGDVHAGVWCPDNETQYRNCPVGHYCPNPDELILCPEGMFCPHKTRQPDITCTPCDAGSETLQRRTYGYVLIGLLGAALLGYIVLTAVRRYKRDLYQHFVELSGRKLDSIRILKLRQERAAQVQKVQHKLFRIQERLSKAHMENGVELNYMSSTDSGRFTFDARALFNALDSDHNGFLNYSELQVVLALNDPQLAEFVRRMNELDGSGVGSKKVSKKCFVRHFLHVLEETSHFGPTPSEVASLFDDIAGYADALEVEFEKFYVSPLSTFLSDPQINDMVARFRRCLPDTRASMRRSSFTKRGSIRDGGSLIRDGQAFIGRSFFRKSVIGQTTLRAQSVPRQVFVEHYPEILAEVTTNPNYMPTSTIRSDDGADDIEDLDSVDLTFEDLSLSVKLGENTVNVVNHVSGRIEAGTMTALMGGSGAGKTSLLNALCGRAFYGETTGTIKVNGHVTAIEDHKGATGFVPQDDIVFAELTVKENLMFSGRFSLPPDTPFSEVEDLADSVLANLGLSRVAHSLVGDVNTRGVSGGERKRVNIGVELMARPSILFLDEPTSGLDSSSALLVMQSLKTLVDKQGVTVLSVIHQPRKFIFDLFDSLVLLGVGGNMVYHGPVYKAEEYFSSMKMPYKLPAGESVADWLIDVSSGRLEPETNDNGVANKTDNIELLLNDDGPSANVLENMPPAKALENMQDQAAERRETLYESWNNYYACLPVYERKRFEAPEPYDLPSIKQKPSFARQLGIQLQRNVLLSRRNRFSKLVDTTLIVAAVILISLFEGIVEVTSENEPEVSFMNLTNGDPVSMAATFPELFRYAYSRTTNLIEYALKIGVITSVLLGLSAAKALTNKRLEFFREAGSGYNVNAYFVAINITSLLEHSFQMLIAASCAFWLRDSLTSWLSYFVNFLLLMWMTVSWSLFIPLLVSPANVVLAVGFFMAFFGLLFSGGLDPVTYANIYDGNPALAVFSGFVSVTRYFIEGMTVQEQRCLPEQSGYTLSPSAVNFPLQLNSFALTNLAQNSNSVVQQYCNGWYWGVAPAILVGITIRFLAAGVIHVSDRSKQAKKPLQHQLKTQMRAVWVLVVFLFVFQVLFILSCWLILRDSGSTGIEPSSQSYSNETLLAFYAEMQGTT